MKSIGRHGHRPAHVHFFIEAPGYRKLTTQINVGVPHPSGAVAWKMTMAAIGVVARLKAKACASLRDIDAAPVLSGGPSPR